ncbi:hypothetical protein KKB68_00390 [Patescibacteria group bacterium]|nr:hypothetical protein [Patescibacteria group bacterium]
MSKKKSRRKIGCFDEQLYKKRPINGLILFSINSVFETDEKCSFERLAKECFDLFPSTFSFLKYPNWPDSRKLDRPLRTLRKRKLIAGSPKASFSLTKSGKKMALEIAKTFRQEQLKI